MKNVALVHWAASAARMGRVERGLGPSSNVRTTSPGASNARSPYGAPNQGPPLASIAATRETPSTPVLAHVCSVSAEADIAPITQNAASNTPVMRMFPPDAQQACTKCCRFVDGSTCASSTQGAGCEIAQSNTLGSARAPGLPNWEDRECARSLWPAASPECMPLL